MLSPNEEILRRKQLAEINASPKNRAQLESTYGQVWDTGQLTADFEVLGFLAPYVIVVRRSDGQKGSLAFQHEPRFYFHFQPNND